MADKKSVGHAYNVDFLNVVFAASSLFLFLSVIWMVWDDFDRDWKNTQRQFARLEYQVTQASLQQAGRAVDKNKLTQLQAQQKDANNKLFRATTAFQTMKATYDQDRYDFEATRANKLPFEKKEAIAKAESEGRQWRILREDDEVFMVTQDYVRTRINFEIDHGKVTKATYG